MYITIVHEELEMIPELDYNSILSAERPRSYGHSGLAETRIVIENEGLQHVRVMRLSREESGLIEFEHRDSEELPFQVRVERG